MKKKLFIGLTALALVVGLSACDASNKTPCTCENSSQWIGSSDSGTPSQDSQGSSSMNKNKSALDILHEAGLTQYGEQTIDETGTVRANNTYYFTESISYYPESNGLLITLDSGETIYTIDGHDRVKAVDSLTTDVIMLQEYTNWHDETADWHDLIRIIAFLTLETYQKVVEEGFNK